MAKIKDNRKDFVKSIKRLSKAIIQLGAVGEHDDTDLSNNDLLAVHEFTDYGGGARAPITKTINSDKFKNKMKSTIQNLIAINYNDRTGKIKTENVLNGMGLVIRNSVKTTIKQGVSPDILEDTLKASEPRLSDLPLMATGQMVNSIEYGIKG